MSNLLAYKNYNGTVEYSDEDECLYGKVVGLKSLISYEGHSIKELRQDFERAVEEYLTDCKQRKIQPEQPFKGSFNEAPNCTGKLLYMPCIMIKV